PWVLLKYADIVIVHSFGLKNLLSKRTSERKIHVIKHFDYRYLLDTDTRANFGKHGMPTKEYILFFGHIAPYKGIDVLINAAKMVRDELQNRSLNFLIAGSGDSSYYDSLLTNDDYENIHILNRRIKTDEIPSLFNNSLFLVLPYTSASMYTVSGVIPLAYTFSKPVIVSDVNTLTEYVDRDITGFIFKSGNSAQLAKCILDLVQDKSKLIEMGERAYQKMIKEMSLERCCELLNNLYHGIAKTDQ
ncbi:MAG TPA: glycosyltransferase family 4 protein, partial [Nitrososphaeraceae archaeon]|nr:glycosyltransferase family 4 protein [Nitrososphaeraceae archaeon]